MPIESPVSAAPAEGGKKKRIAIVDVSSAVEDQARDAAEAKLTATRQELRGFKGFFQKIWKHNLFREYYRQKEIALAKKKITESENLFVEEGSEKEAHEQALKTVTDRFVSEFEETIHAEAGEKRENLGESEIEKAIKAGVKKLISDFATGAINEDNFKEERSRLLCEITGAKRDVVEKGSLYADNLLEIAKQTKEAIEHGAKLEELDLDFEVVVGRAKMGARTEAQYNAVDRIVNKIESSTLGKYLFNEATVASAVSIAYSLSTSLSQRFAQSRLAAWGTFGATALLGGGIAAAREGKKLEDERRQHAREMAQGKDFIPDNSPRRKEMEEYRYETRNALDLLNTLNGSLYEYSGGERKARTLDQAGLDSVLANLTEIESRIALSDRSKIDLIGYSRPDKLEEERLQLDIARAQAKVELRKILAANPGLIIPTGGNFEDCLQALRSAKIDQLTNGDRGIEVQNRLFRKMKRKNVAKAALKGVAVGLVVGGAVQEVGAFFKENQEGAIEHVWASFMGSKSDITGEIHYTPVEYFRRLALGEFPRIPGGAMHDEIIGNQHFKLPEGVNMVKDADGTYKFMRGEEVLAEHLNVNPNGTLTAGSWRALEEGGAHLNTEMTEHVSSVAKGPRALMEENPGVFQKIRRTLWYDNDTPKPVFDKNELKLWWGGVHNTGVDGDGNYVFNVKHMMPNGSFHEKFSADAQEAFAGGKLKMLLSLSRDTQSNVVEIPIDAQGNAVIEPESAIGKMFFELDGKGHAVFKGKFAEVAEMMKNENGIDQVRLLATHEGPGIPDQLVPIVERTPFTIVDLPEDFMVDPPPIIPIFGREPLEPVFILPDRYYYGRQNDKEIKDLEKLFFSRRSKALRENPKAKLDHYGEIEGYLRGMDKNYRKRLEKLVSQLGSMNKENLVSVCIPVAGHQEGKNIYESLKNFSYQTADPEKYEIVLFVNHPDQDRSGKKIKPDETLSEIERFRKDHPKMNIRVMYEVLPINEAKIGLVRKMLNDAVLLRQHSRGKDASDLIMVSNDADNKGVAPEYIDNFIEGFHANPEADGMLGQLDWDPEAYAKFPLIHFGTRIFQYLNAIGRRNSNRMPSSGANFAFRSSIYAAIGGYLENVEGAEDINIGRAIVFGRKDNEAIQFAGARKSRIYTSARRSIDALRKGLSPIEQWERGFSAFDDEVRRIELGGESDGPDYDDPEFLKKLKEGLEYIINRTLDQYEKDEEIGKGAAYYRRALRYLGIRYDLDPKGDVVITNFDKVVENLKRYQEEAVLIRDMKSGKPGAKEKLDELRKRRED